MKSLQDYSEVLDDKNLIEILERQLKSVRETQTVNCVDCDLKRAMTHAFRCLYCGLFFCFNCAEIHFGETFQEYWGKN